MNIPLSPCVPENLVSRDGFSRPVPRQPAHLHTQAESGAYLRDSSRVPRRRPLYVCMAEQRPERFMAKWIFAEKARAGLRCPNVTGRTKGRIAQSKRARAGSLAMVD